MSKMDEVIIVVPRKALFENEKLAFQGVGTDRELIAKLNQNIRANFGIMRRGDAETNTRFKQPIPYSVIRKGDKIFMYERLEGGGEERLHGKLSVGVGGHMNHDGDSFESSLLSNAKRELEEELDIKANSMASTAVGYINDETDDAGLVHIGILNIIDLDSEASVSVKETEQLEGDFVDLDFLRGKAIYDRLENWSKFVVDVLSE